MQTHTYRISRKHFSIYLVCIISIMVNFIILFVSSITPFTVLRLAPGSVSKGFKVLSKLKFICGLPWTLSLLKDLVSIIFWRKYSSFWSPSVWTPVLMFLWALSLYNPWMQFLFVKPLMVFKVKNKVSELCNSHDTEILHKINKKLPPCWCDFSV